MKKDWSVESFIALEVKTKIDEERARCLKAVDDEPEWSPMSREYKRDVANAKKNIRKRIEEGA